MGMTIAEKALARASSRKTVRVGEYVDARIDRLIVNESFVRMHMQAVAAGFQDGIPGIWDRSRFHIYIEHHQPALTLAHTNRQQKVRELAEYYNIANFHDTQCGVIHTLALAECVMPGEVAIGNDSHTCSWGALNCVATALGESELAYALCFGEIWLKVPKTVKVILKGKIPDWNYAKDVFLRLAAMDPNGLALYKALEFSGPAVTKMSMGSRICLATHTVELGGKFGIFPYDETTRDFLRQRGAIDVNTVNSFSADADAQYAQEIEIDLSELEPLVAIPHSIGNVMPISKVGNIKIHQANIGSCANGNLEDMRAVASVLKGKHIAKGTRLYIQPGSWKVYRETMHIGLIDIMLDAGAQVLAPGCHLCMGMQGVMPSGENCVTSFTRNFRGRLGNKEAFVYLAGPQTAAASAIAGKLVDHREI
jgi:3-isopropylmalate/(R)-2-methylmalate dehydratase large subunit